MDVKELCLATRRDAYLGSADWGSRYLDLDQQVREAVTAHPGVVTDFYARFGTSGLELLPVAVVLSDFTSLFLDAQARHDILLGNAPAPHWPQRVTVPKALHEPGGVLEHVLMIDGQPVIRPGFRSCQDEGATRLGEELAPLVESGRLMIRPHPVVVAHTTIVNDKGGSDLRMLDVDPNLPGDTWVFRDSRSQHAVPMGDVREDEGRMLMMASVLLPYLTGVSYADLAKILDDEEHHLAELRASVKDLVKGAAADPRAAHGLIEDKVRPATDKVERRFRSICGMHALRIGGAAVATVAGSLAALLLGPGAAVAAGALAGGTALVTREWGEYMKANSDLRDMPYYLLWRLGRARQG
ncbi:MAG: hypothetical protein K2W96_15245 [Gemmataceae bacterium]|nr:hypothetical protein [Gemmataceae bacterium]